MDSSVPVVSPRGQPNADRESGSEAIETSPAGAQQQRPVYTTAGTVWNPESAKPMRPPVRRGRASVSSLGGDQWSFLSQQNGGGDFHPVPDPVAVPQYSPLRQNNDRAINPLPLVSIPGGDPSPTDMDSFAAGGGRSPGRAGGNAATHHSSQDDMASLKLEEDDDDDATDANDVFVQKLPMKTLVSLASYENPYQQRAQHMLRVKSNPGSSLGSAPTAQQIANEAVVPNTSRSLHPFAATPRFGPAQLTQTNVRSLGDSAAMRPQLPINTQPTNHHARQPGLFPSSTLATGPGAPEPLKAGPPGQRPQGPLEIEGTLAGNLHAAGLNTSTHGVYPTQPFHQYPALNMPKDAGGSAMAAPPRPISVRNHGHDGAGSNHEHIVVASEASAFMAFDLGSHSGIRATMRTAAGETSGSEASSRVATPPGFSSFNRQDAGRSQGNSSQSARSVSGGVKLRKASAYNQPSSYNVMSGQRAHTAHPLPDQRLVADNQPLLAERLGRVDPSGQDSIEARRAQIVGHFPSHFPHNSVQSLARHWDNENLGSNILPVGSAHPCRGGSNIMPGQDGGQRQPSMASQTSMGPQTPWTSQGADFGSREVEKLEPFRWDASGYQKPCFGQYPYGAASMEDEVLRENEAKINAWFYSNTARLGKSMGDALDERRHPNARPSPFGAIGDWRPKPKPEPKKVYPDMSIEEANAIPVSEHAKPLLNLAYQALLDFREIELSRECAKKSERKVRDGENGDSCARLGSAALLPGSFPERAKSG